MGLGAGDALIGEVGQELAVLPMKGEVLEGLVAGESGAEAGGLVAEACEAGLEVGEDLVGELGDPEAVLLGGVEVAEGLLAAGFPGEGGVFPDFILGPVIKGELGFGGGGAVADAGVPQGLGSGGGGKREGGAIEEGRRAWGYHPVCW